MAHLSYYINYLELMGIKYTIRCIADFLIMKFDYYCSGVTIIKCSMVPPTLFFLPVYTKLLTKKLVNMNFEGKDK
jgi:hypothetical protein